MEEQAQNKCRELSDEEKDIKKEYGWSQQWNMSEYAEKYCEEKNI